MERKLDGPPLTRGTEPKGPQASEVYTLVSVCRSRAASTMMRSMDACVKPTHEGLPIPRLSVNKLNNVRLLKNELTCWFL